MIIYYLVYLNLIWSQTLFLSDPNHFQLSSSNLEVRYLLNSFCFQQYCPCFGPRFLSSWKCWLVDRFSYFSHEYFYNFFEYWILFVTKPKQQMEVLVMKNWLGETRIKINDFSFWFPYSKHRSPLQRHFPSGWFKRSRLSFEILSC